jgi:crotonobetainyl-CoA:carnitine CoA-transferase CaiB-like acyl-CoA transferase
MTENNGPLSGITVIDLTRILAGPFCTQLLGDLGANVIKIERPGSGDDTRRFGPPYLHDEAGSNTGESAYFMSCNRNKRSVAIDISSSEGQVLLRRLIEKADVLIENFKVGNLARYGLGYDDLKKDCPGLVYCSVTGFGQTGPYADRPGYDPLIQAMGGVMSVTGNPDGAPQKVGVPIADLMTGMYASVAITSALRSRELTKKGQYIDVSMLDTHVASLSNQAMNYLVSGKNPERLGNGHPNIVPYQTFETADGHVILTVGNDQQFQRFCEFANAPDLPQDIRFDTNANRVVNRDALIEIMVPLLAAKPSDHWLEGMEKLKIGCGPINNIDAVFSDPQVNDRDMVIKMPHAALNGASVALVANPLRLSETAVSYRHPPPLLGEHTDEVLSEILGTDEAEQKSLREAGVI